MEMYTQLVSQIIKDQENIIGPVALEQAKKVSGLEIISSDNVKINGNPKAIIEDLVDQYARLFGRASIEVCKEAIHEVKATFTPDDLPAILQ